MDNNQENKFFWGYLESGRGGEMGWVSVAVYRSLGNFCLVVQREFFSLDGLSAFSVQQRNCCLFLFE